MSPPTYSAPPRSFQRSNFDALRARVQNLLSLSRARVEVLRTSLSPRFAVSEVRPTVSVPAVSSSVISPTMMAGASGRFTTSFECSVCLEYLDQPASIDLDGLTDQNPESTSSSLTGGSVSPVVIDVELDQPVTTSSGGARGGGRSSGGGRGRGRPSVHQVANDNDVDPRTTVATSCGHLYHQACLLKWFREEGKRSCPTCRKLVPNAKLTRLYPSSSSNPGTGHYSGNQMQTESGPDVIAGNVPLPSTSSGSGGSVSASLNTNGACAECRDKTTIHNTLIADYDALQQRYNTSRDKEVLMKTQIESLMEDNTRKDERIDQIQREFSAFRDSVPNPAAPAPLQAEPEPGPLLRRSTRKIVATKRYRRFQI